MIVIRDTTPILFEETFVFLKEEHERIEFNISNTETVDRGNGGKFREIRISRRYRSKK